MSVGDYVPHFATGQYTSAVQFMVACEGWTEGLGFSELAGFNSTVEQAEYCYNGITGNVHTKQFGRNRPPSIALRRALDARGFGQLMAWHTLARMNNPLAKLPAAFSIHDAAGEMVAGFLLEQAWCAKLELDAAQAGSSNVVTVKVTIECDSILMM